MRPRGFAAMSPEKRREIAKKGGRRAHQLGRAHTYTSEEAKVAGQKGGAKTSEDREHMSKIGRIGGTVLSQDREHMSKIGRKGGLSAQHGPATERSPDTERFV